ncbi:hypothetical protein LCGC14_1611660 [marine sediment metagenome]|uniref:LamG-like jellyroll fold domain-containing protein n=1 Tax=marine sediment metagenome TaxID=412755 RepID=A0A0F9IUT9_9ZZZZ
MGISVTGGVKVPQGKFSVTVPPTGPVTITPDAADFDGSDDRLFRSGALSTITDGKQGLISVWFKLGAENASGRMIHISDVTEGSFAKVDVNLSGSGKFAVVGRPTGASASPILNMSSIGTSTTADVWVHAMASWDLGAGPIAQMYINNVEDRAVSITATDNTIDYSFGDTAIGARSWTAGAFWNGCLGELYFTNEFLDLDTASNREKFISGGLPVDLTGGGDAGALPTSTAPILYFSGDSAAFPTNLGTGGSFSVEGGGLATCADSPSV